MEKPMSVTVSLPANIVSALEKSAEMKRVSLGELCREVLEDHVRSSGWLKDGSKDPIPYQAPNLAQW